MTVQDRVPTAENSRTKAEPKLRPLGYTSKVRITGGPLAERVRDALETYLALPVDDILHGFRRQAGLPAPGAPMTGWSSITTQATFGQWVSGLTRIGVTAGAPQAIDRAAELIEGWWATVGSDDHGMSGYGIEKVVCGLVDLAEFGGRPDLLELVAPIAAMSSQVFDRTRPVGTPVDFEGGILHPTRTLEWYTFAENFYRAWLLGAPDPVRDFAEEWHYDAFWDRFAGRPAPGQAWDVPTWLHAYSHLNTFASVAAVYEVTGDPRYLEILRNAHQYFTTTQNFATGGYGPSEFTMPEDGSLGRSLEWRTDCAEIVCGSWAAFKVSSALLEHTGEARYGDWIEQLVYSGIGAVTPVDVSGRSPYYQDYRLGIATKLPHWDDWPCCSGTYLQAVGNLGNLIYFASDDGLAVNLFLPSAVEWEQDGQPWTLEQSTNFPTGDSTRVTLTGGEAATFALRFRVPGWTSGMTVRVNGEPHLVDAAPGRWLEITRCWSTEDQVDVELGAHLRALPVDRWHPDRVAFAHGPIVLAQTAEWTSPISLPIPWQMVDLAQAFTRGDDLVYTPTSVGTGRLPQGALRPLADFPDRAPYRVYFDVDRPRIL